MPTAPSAKIPEKANPFEGNFVGRAAVTVGAEVANVIGVSVQLKTGPNNLYNPGFVTCYLSDNADGSTVAATAPNGGWAIGADGVMIASLTLNKVAIFRSNSVGVFEVNVTESGTPTFYLVVILPDGSQTVSGPITFA